MIRGRLGLDSGRESGLSLIEVVVAMMIFALISVGVIYTMLSVLTISRDTRNRQVAANLAAQEIDLARDIADLFDLDDDPDKQIVLNGEVFHVQRQTRWVSSPDLDLECGAGGGPLRYKAVNVKVTWDGMRSSTAAVRADTVIDPESRINDPSLGTILVSVLDAAGQGASGIQIRALPDSPANGATALPATPDDTDADGCSYILRVTPGDYVVTAQKSGYVDVQQQPIATADWRVDANGAASASFQYDLAAGYDVTYLSNFANGTTRYLPKDLQTTFLSTPFSHTGMTTISESDEPLDKTWKLHPFPAGYHIMAGKYIAPTQLSQGCLSVDPQAWPEVIEGSDTLVGTRASGAAARGTETDVNVPMGAVTINGNSSSGSNNEKWVWAKSAASSYPGDPGCEVGMTYGFNLNLGTNNSRTVGLPFGSWKLYTGQSNGSNLVEINGSRLDPETRGFVSGNVITFDPRTVAP